MCEISYYNFQYRSAQKLAILNRKHIFHLHFQVKMNNPTVQYQVFQDSNSRPCPHKDRALNRYATENLTITLILKKIRHSWKTTKSLIYAHYCHIMFYNPFYIAAVSSFGIFMEKCTRGFSLKHVFRVRCGS